jgi:membrane-associated phospholipid phosphatase
MFRQIVLALALSQPLVAQTDSVSKTLFTRRDAGVAAAFLAASAGLSYFDPKIARFFNDTALSHVRLGERFDSKVTHVNETTLTLAGIAAYGVGRLTKSQTTTDVAFHTTEAIVTSSLASQIIRGPLGRSRPRETNSLNQYDFHWFKGFGNFKYRAFPSIHSASAFAAATALVEETRIRKPGAVKYLAPALYAIALTPGLSRMYLGQHWASDVFAGAFMGTFAGIKTVRYSHTHPDNRFEDWFVPKSGLRVGEVGGHAGLMWSSTF